MSSKTPILVVLSILLAAVFSPASTLSDFRGNYGIRGPVTLKQGGKTLARGKVLLRLRSNAGGSAGSLSVHGHFRLDGSVRPFSETLTFGRLGGASLSNLAPGYEDGLRATGTRTFGSEAITASFPLTLRTTTGSVDVRIRREVRGKRVRLLVTQTLATSALNAPVTWTFTAFARR